MLKFCNKPAHPTSLSFLLPPTPFNLNTYQLNRGKNSQSCNWTPMESAQNYLNNATYWLPQTLILLPSRSLNSKKQTKFHRLKVTLPSVKIETTFLAVVSSSLSVMALSSKSYTPSEKQVRKSYPFESIHQNCYGLMYTTYTFTTPLLSTPTLIQTLSIHPLHSIIILYFNGHSHFWDHV